MTPTAPELLTGCVIALSSLPTDDDSGTYVAGQLGLVAILNIFCAQECDQGVAARVLENAALGELLAELSQTGAGTEGIKLNAANGSVEDLSLAALDAANADLRRRLIQLHEAVEAEGDVAKDRRILAFYRTMAARRALHLPPSTPSS